MTKIITKIIQNRSIKNTNTCCCTKVTEPDPDDNPQLLPIVNPNRIKLDDLPSSIIGEIASYFDQSRYSTFSYTNSTIYIATNTPNTLTEINIPSTSSHIQSILLNHPQTKSLSCSLEAINYLKRHNLRSYTIDQLTYLELDNSTEQTPLFHSVISQNYFNLTPLKKLTLRHFDLQPDELCNLLQKCPNMTQLQLIYVEMGMGSEIMDNNEEDYEFKVDINTLPNITKLSFAEGGGRRVLELFGPKLVELELSFIAYNNIITKDIDFKALQILHVEGVNINQINGVIEGATNLREVFLINNIDFEVDNAVMNDIKQLTTNMIVKLPKLEHLHAVIVEADDDKTKPGLLYDGLEYGLNKTKTRIKDKLRITINVQIGDHELDPMHFHRILSQLIISKTDKVMIEVQYGSWMDVDKSEILKEVDSCAQCSNIKLIQSNKHGFVVGTCECDTDCLCKRDQFKS